MSHSIEVKIQGDTYRLRAEADENYVRELAEYVDEVMRSTAGGMDMRTRARDRVATMAAIQIADSYFQAKKKLESQQQVDEQRIQNLILKADQLLGE